MKDQENTAPKGTLTDKKTNASQEAGGKLGTEEPGDAKWLWSKHGDKSVFVTGEKKRGRGGKADQEKVGRTIVKQ